MQADRKKYLWWQEGIIYQVYPRSFQDSNADGVGDLRGIITRLPYLKELGIKALWVSPIFLPLWLISVTIFPIIPVSTPCSGPWPISTSCWSRCTART